MLDHYFNHRVANRKKSVNAMDCTLPTSKDWKKCMRSRNYNAESK
jgi:hypothetical protein